MLDRTDAINVLFQVHEAALQHVRSIESSVEIMMPLTTSQMSTPNEIKLIRENIRNIGLALYYLKEGELNHENLDKEILTGMIDDAELNMVNEEHAGISRALDYALMLTDLVHSEKWNPEELKSCLKNLKKSIHNLHEAINDHTRKENEFLRRGLSSSK